MTERWQAEGQHPEVGVWTAAQTAQFLRSVRGHRLYALFRLVALRGLRRGEAAGLTWVAVDLEAGMLTVAGQLQHPGRAGRPGCRGFSGRRGGAASGR
jgi:integrase